MIKGKINKILFFVVFTVVSIGIHISKVKASEISSFNERVESDANETELEPILLVETKSNKNINYKFGNDVAGVLDENGVLTISGTGPMYDFAWSREYATSETPLSPIYESDIQKVIITDGVSYVGESAFRNCYYLCEAVIAGSVKEIGNDAFLWDRNLKSVILNTGTETIGCFSFGHCVSLEKVSCPNSLKCIKYDAFYGDVALESVTLPEGLQYIGDSAFGGCVLLTEINIPSSVTELDFSANGIMRACSSVLGYREYSLNNINVSPQNMFYTSIDGVVYSKDRKKLIWYPEGRMNNSYSVVEGTTTIGTNAMSNSFIKKIILPDSITTLEERAFDGAFKLEEINLPKNLVKIGYCAFEACRSIKRLKIPQNVLFIGYRAFSNCMALEDVYINNDEVKVGRATINNGTISDFIFDNCNENLKVHIFKDSTIDQYIDEFGTNIERVYDLPCRYTIVFNGNGSTSGNMSSRTKCIYGTSYTLAANTYKKKGYSFSGWNTKADGSGNSYMNKDTVINLSEKDGTVVTLYAQWADNKSGLTSNGKIKLTTKNAVIILLKKSYTYDGKAKKPTVKIVNLKGKTLKKKYYSVKYTDNVKVGKATLTIKFKGKYTGSIKATYNIKPNATKITGSSEKKDSITLTWKKQKKQVTGYQIQYATDRKFTKNKKTIDIAGAKKSSEAITGLSSRTKYYFRIRTYKTVNGKNYYSSWSKYRAVKTK